MMKTILLSTLLIIFIPILILAEGNDGTEDIFNFGAGARVMGMGRTFVGLADDVSTVYWNPAGIYNIDKKTFSLSYSKLFYDTLYGFIGYVHPTTDYGSFGISILSLHTGDIPGYDDNSSFLDTFSNTKLKFIVGYANRLPWFPLVIGLSLKMNLTSVEDRSATSFNMDIGLIYYLLKDDFKKKALSKDYSLKKNELTLGFTLKNVFNTGERLWIEEDKENTEVKLGVAYLHRFSLKFKLRMLFDVLFYEERTPQFSFGTEICLYKYYFLRAGYTLDSGLTFGSGIHLYGWHINYALVFRPLGATHNFSIDWTFGKGRMDVVRERELKIQARIYKNIKKERKIQKQKYGKIIKMKDKEIKELDKKRKEELLKSEKRIRDLQRRSNEQIDSYRKRLKETILKNDREIKRLKKLKEQELLDLRRNLRKKINEAEKLYKLRLGKLEKDFKSRLKNISLTNVAERKRLRNRFENEKRNLKTQEKQKSKDYSKGVELYNKGQYDDALKYFQRVRVKDAAYADLRKYILLIRAQKRDVTTYSKRILELYRRGVNFYLSKRYREAIAIWQEILKIDPYNKLAIKNIDMAKKRLKYIKNYNR